MPAFNGYIAIKSNDGSEILYEQVDDFSNIYVTVTSTGATISSEYVNDTYTYTGDKNFLGLAVTANATSPDYAIGDTAGGGTYYIVESASVRANVITGDAVPNATGYELYEVMEDPNAGGGILDIETGDISGTQNKIYTLKATSSTLYFTLTTLGLSAGSHIFAVKATADGYTDSDYSNEVTYVQEQLTKPVLTDLSADGVCKFSFPNDTRAYAYKIFVNGVEMGYPLYWSATLSDGIYTVTMNDRAFPSAGTYSITAQAYVTDGSYADSEVSAPLTFTKAASGYTVYISDSFVWADANPPEDVPTIHFVYSDGTSASVSCNSLAASYSNVKSFTVSGESMQDITYTENGTSHTVGTGMTLTADITITRIEIYCLTGDTLITMADGTERRIDSLAVGDEVLSYNPVTMELEADRITYSDAGANKTHNYYDIWEFSDGRILKTVHRHRLYNVESQGMVNMDEWQLGEHALTRDGCAALVKHTHVSETVNHYTIFTGNQNYFANGLLAGNKYTPDMELGCLCK